MRKFDFVSLGGTLYTPAISKHILDIANGIKFPEVKSVVFCLEDAIKDSDVEYAITNIQDMLQNYKQSNIKVFIRAKNIENLKQLLQLKDIEKIDGFSIAKFGVENMESYFDIFNKLDRQYYIMPILESNDMFETQRLIEIRDYLLKQTKQNILTLRIGGEDMFKTLGIKKSCEDSIHDFHISSKIFADILSVFKPYGFNITAPVYNCLNNNEIFKKEVQRDIKEGFFGKTVIHPSQAKIINSCYKVSNDEVSESKEILKSSNEAVFRFQDKMCEPKAHNIWANNILKRADIYGIFN
ncbi:MAG: HpcH/HpaI aldolase/citrate lyase family protein [Campylobacterota bacterium]|nr:HpcH/HpaI aldolase/citrate lyase family protein [Campylobacterota bacterium]